MSNIKDGGPAFPVSESALIRNLQGASLRDVFAANALAGFCANPAVFAANSQYGWGLVNCTEEQLVETCGRLADAMLAERETRGVESVAEALISRTPQAVNERIARYCEPYCTLENREYATERDKLSGGAYICKKCGLDMPF